MSRFSSAPRGTEDPMARPSPGRLSVDRSRLFLATPVLLALAGSAILVGQSPSSPPRRRPPDWNVRGDEGVFFRDAFREALQGSRPEGWKAAGDRGMAGGPSALAEPAGRWSRLVTADVLEQETKGLSNRLQSSVQQPAAFASGGYQRAQQEFGLLSALFGVIHEFDGPVKWKGDAAAARDRFAQLAKATGVGSSAAYQAAKAGRDELSELLRGSPFPHPPSDDPWDWSEVAQRHVLMKQLESSLEGEIRPAIADGISQPPNAARIHHHAQLIRMIAEILLLPDLEDAADADYATYCRAMQAAAGELQQAVTAAESEAARQAAGQLQASCNECHGLYRG